MIPISRAALFFLIVAPTSIVQAESVEWIRQFGTNRSDRSFSVAADSLGNVFVSAETLGNLAGPNAGSSVDIVLSKYNPAGDLIWSQQFGTSSAEESRGSLSADGLGNVYMSGSTKGNLSAPNAGDYDVFVRKFDTAGGLLWSQQFGTTTPDLSGGTSVDGLGNLYVSGKTFTTIAGANGSGFQYVRKYTTDGALQWTTQFGDSIVSGAGVISTDKLGNVFGGDFEYVYKLDSNGSLLWKKNAPAYSVAADGLGNVYVTGFAYPDQAAVQAGNTQVYVAKLDTDGNFIWGTYYGGPSFDSARSIATDGQGAVYVGSYMNIPIPNTNNFQTDMILNKFDSAGNLIWTRQMGTSSEDSIDGISVVGQSIYASGQTFGSFGGPSAGGSEAFVLKIADAAVPEPASAALVGVGALGLLIWKRRRN